MEYDKKNLMSREELAQMVVDTFNAKAEYTAAMRHGDKSNIREKAHAYFGLRDQLVEAARSILVCANLKD